MSKKRYSAEPGEEGKPRRLDQGTIQYLKQIDPELDSISQGQAGGEQDLDTAEILIENVLEELKNRTASAACDRSVNAIVEKICLASSFANVIDLLGRFTPYALFLARNRHSSHILQSTLSRLSFLLKTAGIPEDVDEDDAATVILDFMRPILSDFSFAAKDMNATHVVRAALCVLSGLPVISERRGKSSKHQHSVGLSQPLDSLLLQPDCFVIDSSCCFPVPESFQDLLGTTVIEGLLSLSAPDLQGLCVDTSGAAVTAFIVRVLFSPDVIEGGSDLGNRLLRAVLEWKDDPSNLDGPTVLYAMSGERSGSYFLETALLSCEPEFFVEAVGRAVKTRAAEYAEDNSANFVLQTILRRLLAAVGGASGSVDPEVLQLTVALVEELIEPDVLSMLLSRRGGLLFWVIKLADVLSRVDRSGMDCSGYAPRVVGMLLERWGVTRPSSEGDSSLAFHVEELSRRLSAPPAEGAAEEEAAARAAADRNPAAGTVRSPLQLMTARLVGAVLELSSAETLDRRQLLSRAVAALDRGVLVNIATSGPMSKALLDTIFTAEGDIYATAREKAMNSLLASAIDLSCHFVGQHIIRTYYNSASRPATREKLVLALVGPDVPVEQKERLRRSREGQGILNLTQADLYVRSRDEWKSSMRKFEQGKSLLQELAGMGDSRGGAPAAGERAPRAAEAVSKKREQRVEEVVEPEVPSEPVPAEKRKRKRKRGGNKGKDGAEEEEDEQEGGGDAADSSAALPVLEEAVPEKKRKAPEASIDMNPSATSSFAEDKARHSEKKKKYGEPDRGSKKSHTSDRGSKDRDRSKGREKFAGGNSDMELVKNLNSAKLMSRSMLADTISRLEQEKKMK